MEKKFIMTAFGYAILGLMLGIYMAASKNHDEFVTHAHIMLLGFVVSFIYALCHKLWLNNLKSTLSVVQFYIHLIATLVLFVALFLGYGSFVAFEKLEPILASSSTAAFVGLILMSIMMTKAVKTA